MFGLMHLIVSGLAMAIYRLFCIKSNALVRGQIKERRLFQILHIGGFILTFLLSLMFVYENTSDRIGLNLCTANSEAVAQMRLDYFQSQGLDFPSRKTYQVTSIAINVGMTLIEFGCYISFFHHCYKQDNGRITLFLPKDVTRQRNRRNAISFMGHMYAFMIEFAFMTGTLILLLVTNMEVKYFGSIAKIMEFGLLSAVEVLSSAAMRKSILGDVT